jgi:hypothetical protein
MVKHEEIDVFFRRLIASAPAPQANRQDDLDQSGQLLSAFNKITDPRLRQEVLLLIEIVAQMPERRGRWREGALAQA